MCCSERRVDWAGGGALAGWGVLGCGRWGRDSSTPVSGTTVAGASHDVNGLVSASGLVANHLLGVIFAAARDPSGRSRSDGARSVAPVVVLCADADSAG